MGWSLARSIRQYFFAGTDAIAVKALNPARECFLREFFASDKARSRGGCGIHSGKRFSPLTGINRQNVTQLKPAWVYQMRNAGIVETTPIVADGVMYITEPPSTVTALDVRTGRPLWTYTPNIPPDNLLYWATGNPAPDWNADNRPGDNLYTCSLLALNPADGKVMAFPIHAA